MTLPALKAAFREAAAARKVTVEALLSEWQISKSAFYEICANPDSANLDSLTRLFKSKEALAPHDPQLVIGELVLMRRADHLNFAKSQPN